MANDELIWTIIGHQFCSFRAKLAQERAFCTNKDNVTGLCDRRSCPLANSRYATVKEDNGRAVLWMKTAERAHTPKTMWEKIILPRNYAQALERINKELEYWPSFLRNKNKQRLTKIHQVLIRSRKLLKKEGPVLERIHMKDERREVKREAKALVAARLESTIQKELLERLKQGTYGEIYNYPAEAYEKALKDASAELEQEDEQVLEEEAELDNDDDDEVIYFEGDDDDDEDEDGLNDIEDYWGEDEQSLASNNNSSMSSNNKQSKLSSRRISLDDLESLQSNNNNNTSSSNNNNNVMNSSSNTTSRKNKRIRMDANATTTTSSSSNTNMPTRKGPFVEIEYENEDEEMETAVASNNNSSNRRR
jgi:protein MAK16